MIDKDLFKELITEVFYNISSGIAPHYTYHSPTHVSMVFRDATFLANRLELNESDLQLLQAASALHDYGFLTSHIDHEERSCKEARKFLTKYGFSESDLDKVCGMIMATKIPQSPKTLLEKIICDADLFYLGSNYYFEIAGLFKQELESLNVLKDDEHWKNIQIGFLENHRYHLPFSQKLLDERKANNLSILKSSN